MKVTREEAFSILEIEVRRRERRDAAPGRGAAARARGGPARRAPRACLALPVLCWGAPAAHAS
jgi:hypothetical protein